MKSLSNSPAVITIKTRIDIATIPREEIVLRKNLCPVSLEVSLEGMHLLLLESTVSPLGISPVLERNQILESLFLFMKSAHFF